MIIRALVVSLGLLTATHAVAAETTTTATKKVVKKKTTQKTATAQKAATATTAAAAATAATAAATTTAAPATTAAATTEASAEAAPQTGIAAFLAKIEAARGTALSVAEKGQITTLTQDGKALLDKTQDGFVNKIAGLAGMDPAIVKALFPEAAQPVSGSSAVSKLEEKLGRKLGFIEGPAIKAAASLRNNTLETAKGGVAEKVGKAVGMDKETILSLLPLVGL